MRSIQIIALSATLAGTPGAQQFQFNLEHLQSKASNTFHVSLDAGLVQIAAKFLDDKNPDAQIGRLVIGITGIYVKRFEFTKNGVWAPSDLSGVRIQLTGPEWTPMAGMVTRWGGEDIEVWVRGENGKVSGVAILACRPQEVVVANLVGNVDLDSLADFSGHFEIPSMRKK